jgi:hypothetical protein
MTAAPYDSGSDLAEDLLQHSDLVIPVLQIPRNYDERGGASVLDHQHLPLPQFPRA